MKTDHNRHVGAKCPCEAFWHARFPQFAVRMARMAQHVRTEEAAKLVSELEILDTDMPWMRPAIGAAGRNARRGP